MDHRIFSHEIVEIVEVLSATTTSKKILNRKSIKNVHINVSDCTNLVQVHFHRTFALGGLCLVLSFLLFQLCRMQRFHMNFDLFERWGWH